MIYYAETMNAFEGIMTYVASYDPEAILAMGAVPVRGDTRELEDRIQEDTQGLPELVFSFYPLSSRTVAFFAGDKQHLDQLKELGGEPITDNTNDNLRLVLNCGWGAAKLS